MGWINTQTVNKAGQEPMTEERGIIALDFDGTLVEHAFPAIGQPLPGAIETVKELQALGFRIILLTMRGDQKLQEALVYCNKNNLSFWAVNENPEQKEWTSSPKVYANLYIDDCGIGIPLRRGSNGRPCVDWDKLRQIFVAWKLLEPKEVSNDQTFEIK